MNTSGVASPNSAGNGALMRMAPVIIAAKDEAQALDWALRQTKLTHACEECQIFSEAFAKELWRGKALEEYEHLRLPVETPRRSVIRRLCQGVLPVCGGQSRNLTTLKMR